MGKKQVKSNTTTGVISNNSEKTEVELERETREVISDTEKEILRKINLLKLNKQMTMQILVA